MADIPAVLSVTPASLRYRLYVMMFLQYFIQGSYLPVISEYLKSGLGFGPMEIGWFGSALAVGPLVAPFVIGQFVDRMFATQWVLAVCHLAGGAIMIALYFLESFVPILILGAMYSALYVPSMMLTNSLTFHHLADRSREFPLVRLWGTIGFVLPAWCIEPFYLSRFEGDAMDKARGIVLMSAGVVGIVMAVYCLTLPNTPPDKKSSDFAPGRVLGLLRLRHFAVLVGVSLIVSIAHKYFWVWNAPYLRDLLNSVGIQQAVEQRISSIGQIAEVCVMAVLGIFLSRLGFKRTMLIGATAYMLRFLILAWVITIDGGQAELVAGGWWVTANATAWTMFGLLFLGQALHGLCFACFLAAAYIYVDKVAPPDIRGSMQTFYGTFIVGAGFFFGGLVGSELGDLFISAEGQMDWPSIWLSGAAISGLALVLLAVLFPSGVEEAAESSEGSAPA